MERGHSKQQRHLFALLLLDELETAFDVVLEELGRAAEERLNVRVRMALLELVQLSQSLDEKHSTRVHTSIDCNMHSFGQ